jgi:ppGpp synthetase/RelA/SpoT-type nucleotidyltranferase
MVRVMDDLVRAIEENSRRHEAEHGDKLFEHLNWRIKGDESMRQKLVKRKLVPTARNALRAVTDSIGIRVVCLFIDDVYENVRLLKSLPGCAVVKEKDYIRDAKPNGYRSYHMILDVTAADMDVDGHAPGHYYVEIQLRTIAMDTWAALEHELKYKKDIANPELIAQELHRCANELAACDVSMQTIKNIIRG